MSAGHCGNGCDYDPKTGEDVPSGCKKSGCFCAYVGICRPWWMPQWLGYWLFQRRLLDSQ